MWNRRLNSAGKYILFCHYKLKMECNEGYYLINLSMKFQNKGPYEQMANFSKQKNQNELFKPVFQQTIFKLKTLVVIYDIFNLHITSENTKKGREQINTFNYAGLISLKICIINITFIM